MMAPAKQKGIAVEEPVGAIDDLQTDNLGRAYTAAADNSEESEQSREASMLFSVAEAHLNDDDDPVEAIRIIDQAIAIFRAIGDNDGFADSLRLRMHGTRKYAAQEHEDGHGESEEELLKEAEELCRREMAVFRACNLKRGEAAMLLAVGEALCCLGSSPKMAEALDNLLDAQDLARELGDVKLEALIVYEKSNVLHRCHRYKQASQAAKEAQKLFNSIGDLHNEAFSWLALGSAQINNGRVEDGLLSKRKALGIYKGLGKRKQVGTCLCSFAELHLMEKDEFGRAIKLAQEAKVVFQELGDAHWELQAQRYIVEGNYKLREYKKAMDFAKEGLELARQSGIKKEIFKATYLVAQVNMESGHIDQALDTAAEVMAIAKEMEDPRMTAQACKLCGLIYDFDEMYADAEEQAQEAVRILMGLKRYEEEAFQELHFLGRCFIKKDEYRAALAPIQKARKVARKLEDTYLEAVAMLSISAAHLGLDDLVQATKAAELSRELYHTEGYQRGEARVIRLALTDYKLSDGRPKEALRLAQQGVTLMEENGDNRMACMMKLRVAEIYMADENPTEAARAAMEALKLARVEDDRRATAVVLHTVLSANHLVLSEYPAEERQSKAYRQKVEKMARYAKEYLGIAVKICNTEYEAHANLWVTILDLMLGKEKAALQAAEVTLDLARKCKEVVIEIDASIHKADALDVLGESRQAMELLEETIMKADEYDYDAGKRNAIHLQEQIAERQGKGTKGAFAPLLRQEHQQKRQREIPSHEVYRKPDLARVRSFILQLIRNMNSEEAPIESDQPLFESGIDSLFMVELRTELQQEFRVNLPPQVMFTYPSVRALARFLVGQCTERRIEWNS